MNERTNERAIDQREVRGSTGVWGRERLTACMCVCVCMEDTLRVTVNAF